jgi:signal transduction histidine kinase
MRGDGRLERLVSVAAGVLTAAVVLLPASIYLLTSYRYTAGLLEAEAEINARIVNRVVTANPELWRYEQIRLNEYLSRRPRRGDAERRLVRDERGAVVAESSDPLPAPWLTRSVPILDAGAPVGTIEVSRSLRPLLMRSGILALALLGMGLVSFRAIRTLPLRAIRRSQEAQRELQAKLHDAQKLEAMGRLAGGVAHDFNNLLSIVKGYAVLLRRRVGEELPHRRYVDEILASTDRAASLTASLLAFGRRQALRREPLELAELVRQCVPALRRLVRENVELRTELGEALPLSVDRLQLERVLMNLVTNARDAMPNGGRIVIAASRVALDAEGARRAGLEAPGAYAQLSVEDTGTGIPPEVQEHLFEPFFTTKEAGKGTGLGLSITYAIVQQHGGAIHVESAPGVGTRFTLLLPLLDASPPPARAPDADETVPPGGTETVLLADDDASLREMLREVLASAGYRVVEAVDGTDAVRRFEQHRDRIRLVILDVLMPGQNGKLALDRIRSIDPSVRAFLLSGQEDTACSADLVELGDALLLRKPAHPVELLRTVRRVLDA